MDSTSTIISIYIPNFRNFVKDWWYKLRPSNCALPNRFSSWWKWTWNVPAKKRNGLQMYHFPSFVVSETAAAYACCDETNVDWKRHKLKGNYELAFPCTIAPCKRISHYWVFRSLLLHDCRHSTSVILSLLVGLHRISSIFSKW